MSCTSPALAAQAHKPKPRCVVPKGWQVVVRDAQVVVILYQADLMQEYRYCNYAYYRRGFRLLVRGDEHCCSATSPRVDGVFLSDLLYHLTTSVDSPECNSRGEPVASSTVYAVDTRTGHTESVSEDAGAITSALFSPAGVGAWIVTDYPCDLSGPRTRHESLKVFSFHTRAVTTLDNGDPGETQASAASLANLELYQCAAGCAPNTTVVAWTHDGAWRYAQVS